MEAIKLPSGWQCTTLELIAHQDGYGLVDGPFGSNLPSSDYVQLGVPVIRGSNLSLGTVRFQDERFVYVSEETAKRLERSLCQANDIIFTKKGTLGQVGIVPREARYSHYLISSNQMKLSVDEHIADPLYVYYFVVSPASREKIIRDSEATGVPKTNLAYLRKFPITLPPLAEQHAIAHILGSLDDKIELNRQMNETLEGVACALFKSWFVDFDPVRAKMEGRQPYGMAAETVALFPDGFEDSMLGAIPRGWSIGRLDDLLILQRGYDLPTDQRISGPFPVVSASGPTGFNIEYKVKGPGVVTGRSGLLGKVFFVHENFWPLNTTLYVKDYKLSRPMHSYYLLKNIDFKSFNAGSAVPTLNRNHIHNLPAVIPHHSAIKAFEDLTLPLFNHCYQNDEESQTLTALRDTLLPKLLSGEIRVNDAERVVETRV